MIKKNKWTLLASSIVTLLPILFGLIFWNDLPEQMTTHWGAGGNADGWSSRSFAIFVLPLIMLAAHWLCVLVTRFDTRNKAQNEKVFRLVLWIIPAISLFSNGVVYAVSFGKEVPMFVIMPLLFGLLFVVMGNYMPKCQHNYTIGIKVKWTLENEENWYATHRVAGKTWVIGGILMFALVFLPEELMLWVFFGLILVMVLIPMMYSYRYYKKQVKEGTVDRTRVPENEDIKKMSKKSLILLPVILVVVVVILFTGNVELSYGDTSFTVDADYWSELTVEYDAIDSVEYREQDEVGDRTSGVGSARLLAGLFQNEEYGVYTRYTYTKCDAVVVLNVEGKILVINGIDAESTKQIYEEVVERVE